MRVFYSFIIKIYGGLILIASLFNSKAKKWIKGRKNVFTYIEQNISHTDKIVWFHASSLGEFEQGRPIIESFRDYFPEYKILLTFFSPSGYEVRKNYEKADFICYLPLDTRKNAKKFIELVNPVITFFIKYEFWYNYLNELKRNNIPTYIFSTIFRRKQIFFKSYGKWFLNHLNIFHCLFVQNEESYNLLLKKGITNVIVAGDTRFDRVAKIAENTERFILIEKFKDNNHLILLGSSWPKEEKLISNYVKNSDNITKIIIAPHDISHSHIENIKKIFRNNLLLYSEANENNIEKYKVLVIDSIGILSKLYQYADVAIIGGGFGKGIHNILEALTFGVPVFFGPNYNKFQEAKDIIAIGGGKVIRDSFQLNRELNFLLNDSLKLQTTKKICEKYIKEKRGATEIIMDYLKENIHQ